MDDFVPALKSYNDTVPTVNVLRLCNRFGTGLDCFIHKLPTELVVVIEGFLHAAAREQALPVWKQQKACFERDCQHDERKLHDENYTRDFPLPPKDDECHMMWDFHPISGNLTHRRQAIHYCRKPDASPCQLLEGIYAHSDNSNAFAGKIAHQSAFDRDVALLEKHFGLVLWYTAGLLWNDRRPNHVGSSKIDMPLDALVDEMLSKGQRTLRTQIASNEPPIVYFMLPHGLRWGKWDWSSRDPFPDTGLLGQKLLAAPRPSRGLLSRFSRALKMLGLEPEVSEATR